MGGALHTGPVLSKRLQAAQGAPPPAPSIYRRSMARARAVSTLVTALALHEVALAPITDSYLAKLETLVVRSVWGTTKLSLAKEIAFSIFTARPRVFPVMHVRYERIAWLARVARCPGVT